MGGKARKRPHSREALYTVCMWRTTDKRKRNENAPSWESGSFHARGLTLRLTFMKTSHLDGSGCSVGFSHTPTGISPFETSKQPGLSPSLVGILNKFGQLSSSGFGDPSCAPGPCSRPFPSVWGCCCSPVLEGRYPKILGRGPYLVEWAKGEAYR